MKLLNKINSASLAAAVYISTALPALAADTNIDPCPGTLTGVCDEGFNFSKLVSDVLSYLFVIGAIVALVFLIWGGIKWITSGGDKAKVEGARNTIIGAIIGLIIIFASYLIINLVLSSLFGIKLSELNLPSLVQ